MEKMIRTGILSIITLGLICSFSLAAGPTKVAAYSNHVPMSKNKIYDRTVEWLFTKWESSQNVVLYKDRNEGRIVIQGKLINNPGQILIYRSEIRVREKRIAMTFEIPQGQPDLTPVDRRRARMKLGTIYQSLFAFHRKKTNRSRQVRRSRTSSIVYHGNIKTGVYHAPHCRYYDHKDSGAILMTKKAASRKGFRPCRICNP